MARTWKDVPPELRKAERRQRKERARARKEAKIIRLVLPRTPDPDRKTAA